MDLSRMNRVLEIDKDTFTATVESGVVLKDFQELVEQEGSFLLGTRARRQRPSAEISAPMQEECAP